MGQLEIDAGPQVATRERAWIDVESYLRRIGYEGPCTPTTETLRGVHAAHRLAVPYENLDVTLRRPMPHDPAALFDKIVRRRRGGWCHELNRLFAVLLQSLGYEVAYHSARVFTTTGDVTPDFSHLVLAVSGGQLQERWLADVGFGARGFTGPLRLDDAGEQVDGGSMRYRIVDDPEDAGRRRVLLEYQGTWGPIFSFSRQPRQIEEFEPRRCAQQDELDWIGRRMASIATPEGRVSLNHDRLIVTRGTTREERLLASDADYHAALREHFGIDLDA